MKIEYFKLEDKRARNKHITELYELYKSQFIAFALQRYYPIDKETLEDIYQESFLALYENIQNGKFSGHSSMQTYLFRIGINKINSYFERDKHRITTTLPENILNLIDYNSDDWLQMQEITNLYVRIMEEPCNQILHLFYYERKKMSEIAQILNLESNSAAKMRKYRCTEELKRKLKRRFKREGLI
jgi:RNA polymerase sigma-70 factor (ECF subfamily)